MTLMTHHLPPDVSQADFARALDAFRGVVGDSWVMTEESQLARDLDPYPLLEEERFAPAASVCPDSVEQVQGILRIANDHGIPVSPISTGRNLGYGGGAPRLQGAVILDLKRMNRILEVSEKYGYALVEPGVTYQDLYDHLQANHIKLWLDVPDLGWGSLVGNTLDRGVGYTPYGDHLMMQCGMEVVLANGDVIRTGMGAMPGNNTWQLFPYGFGPVHDGLFSQSNYGVVTKMGMWLMPEPPGYRAYMISFPREEDLGAFVDIVLPLRMNMVIQNAPTLRSVLLDAATIATKKSYYGGKGPVPPGVIRTIMEDQDLGMWNFYGALYGPPPMMDMLWGIIRDAFSQIPGARFYTPEDRPGRNGHVLHSRAKIMAGIPNLDEMSLLDWVDNGGHVAFSPVSAPDGADVMRQYEMVRDRCHEYGTDYISTFIIGMREMHHICLMIYDKTSAEERRSIHDLCNTLVRDAAAAGYGEYRTHLALMDQIAGTYSWNDNSIMRLNETIKDALDPNGILAPGKQGIWPRRLRGRGL
jgi:4-cresol dehydrogenase (hydroxylating)